ncbi:hypothetical protein NECAME_03764, partial [Necator americanus]
CYQHLCRLVNKHPTSECPGICRFTATEYNRFSVVGPEEGSRMSSEICLNPAWITTATPTSTTTEATMRLRAARSIPNFRDLYMESTACKRLCERLFSRIVKSSSSCTPRNDRRCFFESCQGIIGSVAATDDYNECPSICDSMSNGMHYLYLPVPPTMKEVRNICWTFGFPKKARNHLRTTAVTYSNEEFSNCEELCEYLFSGIIENSRCTHPQSELCLLDTCLSIIRSEVSTYQEGIGEECSEICTFISDEMPDIDIARYMTTMEIIRFCAKGVSPKKTTKPPRTTAVTYPYEAFSSCKKLCVYVFPRTLKPYKYFCPDGGKKYNTRTLMDGGQDAKHACPNLCSHMALAMRNRNMDRKQFGKEQIHKFCLKIVPPVRTTKPPRTTAVTGTDIPTTTAEMSFSTTEMHATTTEIPTTTTETPSTTTEISSSTTEMHSTTTEIPTTTTETPSTTAEISSSTTEMHSTTTEIPTTTTETPSTTAEISSSTTEMHSTTTEIPTTTTETPSTTAEISSSTTEMHSTTTEIPTTTTETPSTTAEISSSTTEMHATTTEVPITTTEMSSFTTEMPL